MSEKIEKILPQLNNRWLDIEGVEGIGKGKVDNTDCIIVFISRETGEIKNTIPEMIEGIPVKLIKTGKIILEEE